MDRDKKRSDSNKMFDSLVCNALDFLQRSVGELHESPKYSVIHFCTAIELFLKARLLVEHWVLIYENPKDANLTKFHKGDFKSIGMEDAIARLNNVRSFRISDEAKTVFNRIREHRNRLIHFFHQEYGDKPDDAAIQNVVAEQCRGWFYLYPLLTKAWQNSFASHLSDIELINLAMLQNRAFLRVKFEALSQGIEKGKAKGAGFSVCGACNFEAARVAKGCLAGPLFSVECLVCNNQGRVFQIECSNCNHNTVMNNLFMPQSDREIYGLRSIEVRCNTCPTLIRFNDIINKYPPFDPDELYSPFLALCGNYCLHTGKESAVLFDSKWVCLSCCNDEEEVWECVRCGRFVTGEFAGPLCLDCELEDEQDSQLSSEHIM